MRSASRNPGLAFALNGLAVQSQSWMLNAADIKVSGPKGMVRAQGLAVLFAYVMQTWVKDEDPGLARTMAVLDRELSRGQRWSGFLDDVCSNLGHAQKVLEQLEQHRKGRKRIDCKSIRAKSS